MTNGSLFLVLPANLIEYDGKLYLDEQTYNGLRLWMTNFGATTGAFILRRQDSITPNMKLVESLENFCSLKLIALPDASKPFVFIRHFPSIFWLLWVEVGQTRYRCFSLWGLWGDWGSLAALIASFRDRNSAVWTDTVASRVLAIHSEKKSGLRKFYVRTIARLTGKYEQYVIGKSRAGFFHGMDTFNHYAPFSRNPRLVHNIHLGPEYRIKPRELRQKMSRAGRHPLSIVYAGRAHPDKGILDWLETLAILRDRNVNFQATWFGDGPEIDDANTFIDANDLANFVTLPGPMSDRELLLAKIRSADIFMFCHKTPESPRCLIEALLSGTPIVGYASHYSEDLISIHGGGVLVPQSPTLLGEAVILLANNRNLLAELQKRAAKDGFPMTDEHVFQHRSHMLRELTS